MKLVSNLLLLTCLAWLAVLSVVPDVRQEVLASARYDKWQQHWSQGQPDPRIELGQGLLPTSLPGPLDQQAGSRPHWVEVSFQAPPGSYTLELLLNDTDAKSPPLLVFWLNGRRVGQVQLAPGQGRPAPYAGFDPELTIQLPLTISQPQNLLRIVNQSGSWAAPAKLRLSQGHTLNPARAAYVMLAQKKHYLLPWLALLLLAIFLRLWAKGSLGSALGTMVLLAVASGLALAGAELLFREYLIRFPQARHLAVRHSQSALDFKGMKLSFDKMIEPYPDPEIPYRLKANLDGTFGGHPLKTNSQHMRGPELAEQRPPGLLRVLGLGDSVMFGWGVSWSDTCLVQLSRLLSERLGRPSQSLNLGCPSYNTAVEVALYRKLARAFKPDVVVLIFVENDFSVPSLMFEPVQRWALDRFYLLEQVRRRVAQHWRDAADEAEPVYTSSRSPGPWQERARQAAGPQQRWMKRLHAYYQQMAGPQAVAASLGDLAEMLGEDRALGVVVYYPNTLAPLPDRVSQVLAASRRLGLLALDMTPVFRDYLKAKGLGDMKQAIWVAEKDPHPNRLGHELIARAVAALVLQQGRLKSRTAVGRPGS